MGANPVANGGLLLKDLRLPDFRQFAVKVEKPGAADASSAQVLGHFLKAVMKASFPTHNFRLFGPDETTSNRLEAVFEVTDRASTAIIYPDDGPRFPQRIGYGGVE
jgi:xylulose-5-phosphate/fructose-6-phosphate phosphoketolase